MEVQQEMSTQDIISAVNEWQKCGFVHPLTCIESNHQPLYPDLLENGRVVLRCRDCDFVQTFIPFPITDAWKNRSLDKMKIMIGD